MINNIITAKTNFNPNVFSISNVDVRRLIRSLSVLSVLIRQSASETETALKAFESCCLDLLYKLGKNVFTESKEIVSLI